MTRVAFVLGLLLCGAAPLAAQTVPPASQAGNLPAGFYPKPPCVKPSPDFGRKPDQREIRKVEEYNEKIRAYNKAMPAFNACLVDYANRANHDMREIRAAIEAANASANAN